MQLSGSGDARVYMERERGCGGCAGEKKEWNGVSGGVSGHGRCERGHRVEGGGRF